MKGYTIPKYTVSLYDWKGTLFATDEFTTYKGCRRFYIDYYRNFVGNKQKMYVYIWNNELGRYVRKSKFKESELQGKM